MNTIAIDTHKTILKLKQKGFTEEQAEGLIEALTESGLVTNDVLRDELKTLRLEMSKNTSSIIQWIAALLVAQAAAIVALQNLVG